MVLYMPKVDPLTVFLSSAREYPRSTNDCISHGPASPICNGLECEQPEIVIKIEEPATSSFALVVGDGFLSKLCPSCKALVHEM